MARILLADADAFFVGVARLADPEGAGRAPLLIVGGSRDSRGVVCSASYETRKFGVRSAMPIARALRLCPNAMCVPVPFKACLAKSAEIRDSEIEHSIVLEGSVISDLANRVEDSLIGRNVKIHRMPVKPSAYRFMLGDNSEVGIRW